MRESVGGLWLLNIVLVFLFLYMIFLAFVVRYVYVVRVKNNIINQIEEIEGLNNMADFNRVVDKTGYKGEANAKAKVCVRKGTVGYTYTVGLAVVFKFPFKTNLVIPVSGQTRTIRSPKEKPIKNIGIPVTGTSACKIGV